MKTYSRSITMLFEIIIVVIFLCVSSITILGVFTYAHELSDDSIHETHAILIAQNTLDNLCAGLENENEFEKQMGEFFYDIKVDKDIEKHSAGNLNYYTVTVDYNNNEIIQVSTAYYETLEEI